MRVVILVILLFSLFIPQSAIAIIPPEPGQPYCASLGGICKANCSGGETVNYNGYCTNYRNRCCIPPAPINTCSVDGGSRNSQGCRCGSFGGGNYVGCAGGLMCRTNQLWCINQIGGTCSAYAGMSTTSNSPPYNITDYSIANNVWTPIGSHVDNSFGGFCQPISGGGGGSLRYTISGHVFGDYNGDDKQNQSPGLPPDLNLQGVTLTLGGKASGTTSTNSSGNYSFINLLGGNYTVTITLPPGYANHSTVQYQINLNANKGGYNFGIIPVFSISGNVFNDINKNRIKDITNGVAETNITSGIAITATGGNLNVNSAAGTYSINNLLAGTYTVSYTSPIPAGYIFVYPLNGPPPQHNITVGPNCNQTVNLILSSTCSNGNIENANFAISNSIPWIQGYGFNMRLDEGFEDKIPTNPIYPPYASVLDQLNAF